MAYDFENWSKIDENIPIKSNFTGEDILHSSLQTNESGEIGNEEIEFEPETDTEKHASPSEMKKILRVSRRGVQRAT